MFDSIPDRERPGSKQSIRALSIAFAILGCLVLTVFLLTPRTVHWTVSNGELQIRSKVWNDQFPLSDLQLERARILDLKQDPGWMPQEKHFGYNGFGYDAGRFKLRNGETADIYLAKETTAILIPKRSSVPLVVGVDDPGIFLAALKDAVVR
jgi:hypothetical protein